MPGAVARFVRTSLWDNTATGLTAQGGAIAAVQADVTISGCSLLRNRAIASASALAPVSGSAFAISATASELQTPGVRARARLDLSYLLFGS